MNNDIAIKVENVSKKYCKSLKRSMLYGMKDILRNTLGLSSHSYKLRKDEFWAVDNLSFEIKRGETLGIFWPDQGKITIRGKVGALIQVGAGFHPMLNGRENVYINGAIIGMSKKEIDEKFDDIVKFADIGDFIDAPVKYYSSGMYIRLGFAVAIHCEPDVLLVDEVLAEGDSNFVIKSLNRIDSLVKKDKMTLIYISHNNTMIRAVCQKALYLENGACKKFGRVEDVIREYEIDSLEKRAKSRSNGYQRIKSKYKAAINQVLLLDKNNHQKDLFRIGDSLKIRVYITAEEILKDPSIQLVIYNENKECMLNQISKTDNKIFPPIFGDAYIDFLIDKIPFNSGIYSLSAKLIDGNLINTIDYHIDVCHFKIESGNYVGFNAKTYLDGKWKMSING